LLQEMLKSSSIGEAVTAEWLPSMVPSSFC
jgi:hypothetical protein